MILLPGRVSCKGLSVMCKVFPHGGYSIKNSTPRLLFFFHQPNKLNTQINFCIYSSLLVDVKTNVNQGIKKTPRYLFRDVAFPGVLKLIIVSIG